MSTGLIDINHESQSLCKREFKSNPFWTLSMRPGPSFTTRDCGTRCWDNWFLLHYVYALEWQNIKALVHSQNDFEELYERPPNPRIEKGRYRIARWHTADLGHELHHEMSRPNVHVSLDNKRMIYLYRWSYRTASWYSPTLCFHPCFSTVKKYQAMNST